MSNTNDLQAVTFRTEPAAADRDAVRAIVASTGVFRPAEIDIAVELVDERLARGAASGYHFIFAEIAGRVAGYACWGPIACTVSSADLYWIAVERKLHAKGLGGRVLLRAEQAARAYGMTRMYAETSSRPDYATTRSFYEHNGYVLDALVRDFYDTDDGKCIYVKIMSDTRQRTGA